MLCSLASCIYLYNSNARVIVDGPGAARIVLDAPDTEDSGSGDDSSQEGKEGTRPWSWVQNGEQPAKTTVIADEDQSTESSGPDDDAVVEISPRRGVGASNGAVEHGNSHSTSSDSPAEDLWSPTESKRLFGWRCLPIVHRLTMDLPLCFRSIRLCA